jgi:hypothetical protein
MVREYDRIYDPGHSWLEVPIKDVRDSGILYLEEDCDLYTFYQAMTKLKGYTININNINVDDFDQYLQNQ